VILLLGIGPGLMLILPRRSVTFFRTPFIRTSGYSE
jgi:hypothetical protein